MLRAAGQFVSGLGSQRLRAGCKSWFRTECVNNAYIATFMDCQSAIPNCAASTCNKLSCLSCVCKLYLQNSRFELRT